MYKETEQLRSRKHYEDFQPLNHIANIFRKKN